MSNLAIITLQPDASGLLHTAVGDATPAEELACIVDGAETRTLARKGGPRAHCTVDLNQAVGGGGSSESPRMGAIALPFVRHLFGAFEHGFNGDASLMVGLCASTLSVGQVVSLTGYNVQLGIATISAVTPATATAVEVFGIVRGVIESDTKRARGNGGNLGVTGTIHAVQLFGTCLAMVKATAPLTSGTKLYIDTASTSLTDTVTDTFFAHYLGGSIALGGPDPVSWVFIPLGRASATPVFVMDWGDIGTPTPTPPEGNVFDTTKLPGGEFAFLKEVRPPTPAEIAAAVAAGKPVPTTIFEFSHRCLPLTTGGGA